VESGSRPKGSLERIAPTRGWKAPNHRIYLAKYRKRSAKRIDIAQLLGETTAPIFAMSI
jgi:hypothetical protein